MQIMQSIFKRTDRQFYTFSGENLPTFVTCLDFLPLTVANLLTITYGPVFWPILVHTFISCRLDYCNALLYGIADCHLQRLQSVQNAAARLVMACGERSTSRRSWSICTGYRFGNGWLTSWQLWCTNALMVALRGSWQSFVVLASTDVQEWDQPTVGSSTYHVRRLHLVTGRSPSLVHALGTTYLMPSKTRLCHS